MGAGQLYKVKHGDEFVGGPTFYIEKIFGGNKFAKVLAFIYAVIAVIGIGLLLAGLLSDAFAKNYQNSK